MADYKIIVETRRPMMHQCPCDSACKCVMNEPCFGCETYAEWYIQSRQPKPKKETRGRPKGSKNKVTPNKAVLDMMKKADACYNQKRKKK